MSVVSYSTTETPKLEWQSFNEANKVVADTHRIEYKATMMVAQQVQPTTFITAGTRPAPKTILLVLFRFLPVRGFLIDQKNTLSKFKSIK